VHYGRALSTNPRRKSPRPQGVARRRAPARNVDVFHMRRTCSRPAGNQSPRLPHSRPLTHKGVWMKTCCRPRSPARCICACLLWFSPIRCPIPSAPHHRGGQNGKSATLATAVDLSKKTNPRSVAEIDALGRRIEGGRGERTGGQGARAGFFEGCRAKGRSGRSLTTGLEKHQCGGRGDVGKDGHRLAPQIIASANYQRSNGTTTANRYPGEL